MLKAIREHIYSAPEPLRAIIEDAEFKKVFPEIIGKKLKTAPRGYPKDWPQIALLRHKSYAVGTAISDEIFQNDDWDAILKPMQVMQNFNRYLNEAIG